MFCTCLLHTLLVAWSCCWFVQSYEVVELDSSHFELMQMEYDYIAVLFYDSSEEGQRIQDEWIEGMKDVPSQLPEGCEIAMVKFF